MALSVNTVWECNASATAGNSNGGGFNPTNANMATDLVVVSGGTGNTPVVSSASYNFVSGDINAWLYIKSGTNFTPGWYQISSVASNQATLSAAVGAAIQTSSTQGPPSPRYLTNSVAGCATTATPTGGTWSVDYSQGTTATQTSTTLVSDAGTPSTWSGGSLTYGPNLVGNIALVRGGTNWTVAWYEIVSVTATTIVVDKTSGTGTTGGTISIGGAISLGGSTTSRTDSSFFAQMSGTNGTGGNRVFIKAGSYTMGVSVTAGAGGTLEPVAYEGYNTLRGDTPVGANRPTLIFGALTFTGGSSNSVFNIIATGTAATFWTSGTIINVFSNCKISNLSSTATRIALNPGQSYISNCEFQSYRGIAISAGGGSPFVVQNCYIHDSDTGISYSNTGSPVIDNNIIASCVTAAIALSGAIVTANTSITRNTLYGAENKTGIGLNISNAASGRLIVMNNIFYGFVTGVSFNTANDSNYSNYNDYFNNTTDRTNWKLGANDATVNPSFTNATQVTGTAGAFVAGNNKLVDTTKNFSSLGVVAGNFIYIVSGTGSTAGIYLIDSISTTTNPNDTLNITTPNSPGTSTTTDKVYQITLGYNFAVGTNLKALGFPGAFQGASPTGPTTGFLDIGAAQRQEPSGGSGGSFTFGS